MPGDEFPRLQSVYQQLHSYPVGQTGAGRAEECRGNKYHITPVRREFLSDLRVLVALDGPVDFESAVRSGLRGEGSDSRYGIPFLGDNSFLLDHLEEILRPGERFRTTCWYERIGTETTKARPRATRLTILIDRADMSKTESALFAPTEPQPADDPPPPACWAEIRPPQPETFPPTGAAAEAFPEKVTPKEPPMIPLPVLDSHDPVMRTEALHALAYCPRLFYLQEVERIESPDERVYAGRELHASLEADEDGERGQPRTRPTRRSAWSARWTALRRRDGSYLPYEHKRGKPARRDGKTAAAWPSDRLQVSPTPS